VIAYKFLCAGAIGPFSRFAWPPPRRRGPGAWVTGTPDPAPCRGAVHACRTSDLPWWLQDELWEAELDGEVATGRHKVMAPRGRLLRRVEGWDAACSQRFADACAARARDHAAAALERAGADGLASGLRAAVTPAAILDAVGGAVPPAVARIPHMMAGDAATRALGASAVVAAYIAAHAAAQVDGPDAMDAERTWQAAWLRSELALPV
jgi:hypothetical protein